jgi:hypothetical protein
MRLVQDAPDDRAEDLRGDQHRRSDGVERAEDAFDEGDDRVERGRDRLQGQDQRDQDGAGGQAVLQQLEAGIAG